MEKMQGCLVLLLVILFGCSSPAKRDLIGVWKNNNIQIQLNDDNTFKASNLPLDIENKSYIKFDKELKIWQGSWLLEGNQIKLSILDSYYYIDIKDMGSLIGIQLCVKLLEESGGEAICFIKE
jgi:hypothetical protein